MSDRLEERLVNELSNCIARHADWLDGRTFQRLALHAARAYFEEDDLNDYLNTEDALKVFDTALKMAIDPATE